MDMKMGVHGGQHRMLPGDYTTRFYVPGQNQQTLGAWSVLPGTGCDRYAFGRRSTGRHEKVVLAESLLEAVEGQEDNLQGLEHSR